MWMYWFRICDLLASLLPVRKWRHHIRRDKLFDWHRKYAVLRHAFPELNFHNTKMVKGGWNIGFIVDNKYVFKVRKKTDANIPHIKITKEKRITDALRPFSPVQILNIDIVQLKGYVFYKYDFIKGKNLNLFGLRTLNKHKNTWAHQIAEFIYNIHNAQLDGLDDLKIDDGDGWNHNDICNNIIINPKTMKIVGIIDWEYSGWGLLATEIRNCTRFSKKMRASGIGELIQNEYDKMANKSL